MCTTASDEGNVFLEDAVETINEVLNHEISIFHFDVKEFIQALLGQPRQIHSRLRIRLTLGPWHPALRIMSQSVSQYARKYCTKL